MVKYLESRKRRRKSREKAMWAREMGGCDGGRTPPCQRMRKEDLVLTKARSRSTASLFPGLCSGPVATCFFHPSSCSFTLLFVSPSQFFSPQLVLCSHLPPLNWAASGRFLTLEIFILISNSSESSTVSFTHSLFSFFLYFLFTPFPPLFLVFPFNFPSFLSSFLFSFLLSPLSPHPMSLSAFELLKSFPSPASLPTKEGSRQLLAEQGKELTCSGVSLASQALLS